MACQTRRGREHTDMATTYSTTNGDRLDPALAAALVAALRGLRFGSIEIVLHDSRVVHVERRERVRLGEAETPPRNVR
jgi:hypothetical protein